MDGKVLEIVGKTEFIKMVNKYHYSRVLPRLSKIFLADRELSAVVSLGWGVRPLQTIQKIFPTLGTADYYEIGKLCVAESSPHGTESLFLSRIINWLKKNRPEIKLLFTWADGMMGKVGYIYQASNFLYGGFIWTHTYISNNGEKIHPRTAQGLHAKKYGKQGTKYGKGNGELASEYGWSKYQGKQFRYCYPLCSRGEVKRLLKSSPFSWGRGYPKAQDLAWKKSYSGVWTECDAPIFSREAVEFSQNSKSVIALARQELLFGDIDAEEVSREKRTESIGEGVGRFHDSAQ
jgi:hypothetical protein